MLRHRILFLFTVVFFSSLAIAGAKPSVQHKIKVEWYTPVIMQSLANNRARVLIRGKTTPGNRASIGANAYSFKSQTNFSTLAPQYLNVTPSRAIADKNGNFQINMTLPYSAVQIPVVVTDSNGQSQTIILLLHVERNRIQVNVKTMAWNLWRVIVGPTFKFYNMNESNSLVSSKVSSTLLGSTVAGEYNFHRNYLAAFSLTSMQGVGSLPTTGDFTFSDFEVALGVSRRFKTKWFKKLRKSVELSYTNASSPFLVRNSSSAYVFYTAALNKLAVTFTGAFGSGDYFNSAVSFGLLYGLLNSSKFTSNPGELGAILNYRIVHDLDSQFYILGDLGAEYDMYSFSSFDPPSSSTLTNSMNQLVGTANVAIACKF